MNKKTLSATLRTKQFDALIGSGLKLVSTDKQLDNGTLVLTGKIKVGRKTIRPNYKVTARGAVLSNEFVARRVDPCIAGTVPGYRAGLAHILEILSKRLAA